MVREREGKRRIDVVRFAVINFSGLDILHVLQPPPILCFACYDGFIMFASTIKAYLSACLIYYDIIFVFGFSLCFDVL